MRAIEIRDGQLMLADRPMPVPDAGNVLIRVQAAGVNRPDIMQRQGKYPPPPGASDIPGLEVAGDVVESRSGRWKPGDRVCALLSGGGYAEYVVAPEGQCLPVPDGLTVVEAAALPETFFTVWNNLFVRGELKAGETMLAHGGASGIGTTAIQMAKALGARVAVTAGSEEKCKACRDLGADLAVNYKTEDYVAAIENSFGRNAVNVVLDMVGGPYIARDIELMAPEGRHVSIASMGGSKAEIDIWQMMAKRITITGSTLRSRTVEEKTRLAEGLERTIWPLLTAGKIKPVIHRTFPLSDAQAAHEAMEAGDHIGKIVLTC